MANEMLANFIKKKVLNEEWTKEILSQSEITAKFFKTIIQMLIGIAIALLIVAEISSFFMPESALETLNNLFPEKLVLLVHMDILKMVSLGLGAATGIELAYMLFTDGPDEAVDPLIMGIASFVLAQLSDSKSFGISKGFGIFLLVILIPILFWVKNNFFQKDE